MIERSRANVCQIVATIHRATESVFALRVVLTEVFTQAVETHPSATAVGEIGNRIVDATHRGIAAIHRTGIQIVAIPCHTGTTGAVETNILQRAHISVVANGVVRKFFVIYAGFGIAVVHRTLLVVVGIDHPATHALSTFASCPDTFARIARRALVAVVAQSQDRFVGTTAPRNTDAFQTFIVGIAVVEVRRETYTVCTGITQAADVVIVAGVLYCWYTHIRYPFRKPRRYRGFHRHRCWPFHPRTLY